MTFALVFSVFLTGILTGFFLTCLIVFYSFKKENGSLMRNSAGDFLKEFGAAIQIKPESPKFPN